MRLGDVVPQEVETMEDLEETLLVEEGPEEASAGPGLQWEEVVSLAVVVVSRLAQVRDSNLCGIPLNI